ncbi:site-specific integrase [Sphingomonas cannabina]|uniref:tyrosine-type recombinase/integrase n=1 Tax=Sphingomonas cannabina TaxID=2899123 RepID=UPI001F484D6B|nr:site-specific integrase [Sphingomonas cannabina]UIJ43742.1 site-specific integrase [Sphingomonas cannabina]
MSLYRREGSPYWWFSFSIDGQRFRGSTGETGKREALKVEDDHKLAARKRGKRKKEWTVHRLCQIYYDEHAKDLSSSATILNQLGKLEDYIGKDRKLGSITNSTVMDYRARRRGDGLQQHSVNREVTILRAALRYVAKVHNAPIPDLAWDALKTKEPPGRTRFLTFEEWDSLLAAAEPSLKPILICAVTTGLRKRNILDLDWSQVFLGAKRIQVVAKGDKNHEVRIQPQLLAALSTTAIDQRRGRVFDITNFEKRWKAALKAAKLENVRFHDLRHTFASWARQNGADIADVKDALGHSDISMTMRYAHIKPDAADTAFDRVSAALSSHSASQRRKKRQKS